MPPRLRQSLSELPQHPDRIISEVDAARLRGVSRDTLRRLAITTGKPRRRHGSRPGASAICCRRCSTFDRSRSPQ